MREISDVSLKRTAESLIVNHRHTFKTVLTIIQMWEFPPLSVRIRMSEYCQIICFVRWTVGWLVWLFYCAKAGIFRQVQHPHLGLDFSKCSDFQMCQELDSLNYLENVALTEMVEPLKTWLWTFFENFLRLAGRNTRPIPTQF